MTHAERKERIAAYGAAHDQLLAALDRFPSEMWQFRPAPDRWTIHEVIIHITDSEANSYVRCRRLLAEPGGAVLGYDESGWARALHYHNQSTDDALALFKWLRHNSYLLIRDAEESVWSHSVQHSQDGWITMDDWLDTYARHIPEHIAQMEAIFDAWLRQQGSAGAQ